MVRGEHPATLGLPLPVSVQRPVLLSGNRPVVTVVAVERLVHLVDEGVLEHVPLKDGDSLEHVAPGHELATVRPGRLVTISLLNQRVEGFEALPPHHRVHEREGHQRVLEPCHDVARVAGAHEPGDAEGRAQESLRDEVHLSHRASALAVLVVSSHLEDRAQPEGQVLKEDDVSVTEVVGDVQRVVQVGDALVAGPRPTLPVLIVLPTHAEGSEDSCDCQDAGQRHLSTDHRYASIHVLQRVSEVVLLGDVCRILPRHLVQALHQELVDSPSLGAGHEHRYDVIQSVQAEDVHRRVEAVGGEHARQTNEEARRELHEPVRAVQHRIHDSSERAA